MADVGTIFRANDSGGDGGIQSKGAAEGQNPIADLYAIGITELGSGEFVVRFNFDYGEIGVFVDADYVRVVMSGIAVNGDLNFCGLVNDVIVGEDEALLVNDDSGAEAAFSVLAAIGRIEEAVEEILEITLSVRALGALWVSRLPAWWKYLQPTARLFLEIVANPLESVTGSGMTSSEAPLEPV